MMLVFSFSKFKLPHYLNGLIPILSVFTASYIFEIFEKINGKKPEFLGDSVGGDFGKFSRRFIAHVLFYRNS